MSYNESQAFNCTQLPKFRDKKNTRDPKRGAEKRWP